MTLSYLDVNGVPGSEALQMVDLHSAAKQDDREAVVRLIKEGANVNKRDPYGYTPLHWASQKGHTHTVQALLAAGASVHVRDKWRRTPLHRAAKEGHKETVAALLSFGAEVNAQGDSNWTPLHCSSFHGQVEIVEMLLSHGADESAKDIHGRTVAAVCDMAQYDVDESVRQEIRKLLESPPPRLERDASSLATLSPSLTAASVVDADDAESAAAAAAAAAAEKAAAASSAKTVADSAKAKPEDVATKAAGEMSGVIAAWAPNNGGGEGGDGAANIGSGELEPGGMMLDDWAEDPDLREMWAMLHVPDPDNPDNNLYTEVKTLRKDVKRLRSDLSDTGDDTSSYDGVLGDLTSVALRASDTDGDFDAIAAAIPEENTGRISYSFPCEETISPSLANNRGGNDVPPTKRQKGWDRDLATLREDSGSLLSVVPKGVSRAASEDSSDCFGVRTRSDMVLVRTQEEVAMLDEEQLRQQVLMQLGVIEEMSKKIEALEREQGRTKESFSSPLPVMKRVSIDVATI